VEEEAPGPAPGTIIAGPEAAAATDIKEPDAEEAPKEKKKKKRTDPGEGPGHDDGVAGTP
jgi:hypothetical protein